MTREDDLIKFMINFKFTLFLNVIIVLIYFFKGMRRK